MERTFLMKKLAICFFGQIRFNASFNAFYPALQDYLNDYDIDFFISTWNDCDPSKIDLNFKYKEFLNLEDTNIGQDEAHTKKAMYLISRVGLLKRKYELENDFAYDAVLLIRPDVGFSIQEFSSKLRKLDFKKESRPVVYTAREYEYQEMDSQHVKRLNEDWFFLFSSDAFDIHTTLYNSIYKTQRWRYSSQKLYIGGHWNHLFYFQYLNIEVKNLDISTLIVRPTRDLEVYCHNYEEEDLVPIIVKHSRDWELLEKTEELKHKDGRIVPFKGRIL